MTVAQIIIVACFSIIGIWTVWELMINAPENDNKKVLGGFNFFVYAFLITFLIAHCITNNQAEPEYEEVKETFYRLKQPK